MSTSAILISTVLVVLFVLALALLTGSLALLAGGHRGALEQHGGLAGALRLLDRQWPIEHLVYRYHRAFGVVVLAAGVFCLWQLTRPELSALLGSRSSASILLWVLLLGQGINLLAGPILFFRPSLLKPVETVSNRWHELDVSGKAQQTRPRITALLLALVGLAVLLGTATLLLQQLTPIFG